MNSNKTNDALNCVLRASLPALIATVVRAVTVVFLLAIVLTSARPTEAQTESVLYSFTGKPNGDIPIGGLIVDAIGDFYGTTYGGGTSGYGIVFKITPNGKETVLYSFAGADGSGPAAGLVQANGNLYGTTMVGGANSFGTVFRLTSGRRERVLASFAIGDGGGYPDASLVRDKDGNFYGTNSGYNGGYGNGAVFKVTPNGIVTILYKFSGGSDGLCPYGALVRDSNGNLYGTTYRGGASGYGTVFKVTPHGRETVLYSFTGGPDGSFPTAGLLRDAEGNLFGTTAGGGRDNYGTIFKVTKTGTETVLHSFTGGDGYYPFAGLVQDAKGDFYGTTEFGGSAGYGTVFKVTKTGTERVLYSFTGGLDGGNPVAGLVFDKRGNLFGTTSAGGNSNCFGGCGVIFKLIP